MTDRSPDLPRDFARDLRGFGLVGILAIILILAGNSLFVPLSALLVLLWAWLSHTPWRQLGFARPKSWLITITAAIVFGVAFKLIMKAIVMPLLGADPINQPYHYLVGNRAALPEMLYVIIAGAGFGEEVVFRAWSFERLGKIFCEKPWAKGLIVLITSTWFGLEHYSFQGVPGTEQAFIVGLVFGTIFAITRRIWFLMIAHAAFDLFALAIIYNDLETKVAHLIFK
jgi:membrane protease YdiL (CAAX protease family)